MFLADINMRENKVDSAAYYAKKSIALVENTKLQNLRMPMAKLLSEIYKGKDDSQAMKYATIFIEENTNLNNAKKLQQTQLMMFNEELRQQSIAEEN